MALRYFYQIDLNGLPIGGTNVAKGKKPTTTGAGQKYVEYIPLAKTRPCCEDGPLKITSIGRSWRYYVRISESTNLPISGTLQKRHFPSPTYTWQEVVGKTQCATTPTWNATWNIPTGESPSVIDLAAALNMSLDNYTFVAFSDLTTNMTVDMDVAGILTVTQADSAVDSTDTVTLQYTSNGCTFAFQVILVYTA